MRVRYCVAAFCFFSKQKTAYEMRMSYWSSDVCSSDLDALVAEPDRLRVLQIGIGLHPGGIGGRQTLQHVEIAGAQVGEPDGGVRNRQEDHLVEVIGVSIPILGKTLQDDAVLRHPLDELVGA